MELINTLSNKITHVLESILHINHEDKTNKIEMLRKVENELWNLMNKREYVVNKQKTKFDISTLEPGKQPPPLLEDLESKVDKERKDKRRINAQELQDAIRREKQEKNDAKKIKQQNLVIFKGRPEMQRARKKDLKPKKKNDDKPSQEIID